MRVPRGSNRREPGKVARSLIHLQHLYLSLLLLDAVVSEDLSHCLQYVPPRSRHLSRCLLELPHLLQPRLGVPGGKGKAGLVQQLPSPCRQAPNAVQRRVPWAWVTPRPPAPFLPLVYKWLPSTTAGSRRGRSGALDARRVSAGSRKPAETAPQSAFLGKKALLPSRPQLLFRQS